MIPLVELKQHLRIEHSDSDLEIADFCRTAQNYIESRCRRVLIQRIVTWRIPSFPSNSKSIVIPVTPVVSVESIQYVDDDGNPQTMPSTDYVPVIDDDYSMVSLAYDVTWPSTRRQPLAVTLSLRAGKTVPPPEAVHAVKLLVGHWYENREAVGTVGQPIMLSANALIDSLKCSYTVTV